MTSRMMLSFALAWALVESHAPERSKSHISCKSCLVSSSARATAAPDWPRGSILTCSRKVKPVMPSKDSERVNMTAVSGSARCAKLVPFAILRKRRTSKDEKWETPSVIAYEVAFPSSKHDLVQLASVFFSPRLTFGPSARRGSGGLAQIELLMHSAVWYKLLAACKNRHSSEDRRVRTNETKRPWWGRRETHDTVAILAMLEGRE